MEIKAQSEWMLDQKHAEVMGPGRDFQVVQTPSGTSVFFSIGSDQVFYACCEAQAGSTGWGRVDLSSNLLAPQDNRKVIAKSFSVSQNPESLFFDLALAVTIGGTDQLYLSYGNANTEEAWSRSNGQLGVQWTSIPFDSTRGDSNINIDNVYLMTLPSAGKPAGSQTCLVDILQGTPATNTMKLLDRYYIKPDSRIRWNKHTLPIDLSAGSISSCLGRRAKDRVGGIYTLGQITDRIQLIYAPAYDFWDPANPPAPVRLSLPENVTSMASATDLTGYSNLFVSSQQGIFVFPPDAQTDGATGTRIITTSLVSQALKLSAETRGGITALYGVSSQGDLFYTTCKAGSEALGASWTPPVPIVSQIQNYAFLLNKQTSTSVVFAHVKGQELAQLIQDPVTRDWASRSLLLPSTAVDDIVTLSTFTTRLSYRDASGGSPANTDIYITATSPVGVYINDSYRILNPRTAIRATTDAKGTITIVQPTQDMSAICYKATLVGHSNTSAEVDPAAKIKTRLAAIQSADDLLNAKVLQSDGNSRPLLSGDISKEDREAAVTAIKQLVSISSTLPSSGIPQGQSNTHSTTNAVRSDESEKPTQLLRITAPHGPGVSIALTTSAFESVKSVLVNAGDMFRSLLHAAWQAAKGFVIRVVDGIHEVLVQIGDTIYRAILDTVSAVTHAFEWVFSKLKVAFEDLKSFLGFVFNWKDIVRTHKVIKNVATQYAMYSVSRIAELENFVTTGLESLEHKIDSWAGIPDIKTTTGQASNSKNSGTDDPQTYYLQEKLKSNIGNAQTSAGPVAMEKSGWSGVLDDLKGLVLEEADTVKATITRIKEQIIDQVGSLTPLEIVKRLLAIISDLVLETVKHVVVKTLSIVKDLTTAVIEELNKPISIPIISKLYKEVANEELSIMDLVCLVAAVPATLLNKVITQSAPFPDNATTTALIQATDFQSIQKVMSADASVYKTFSIVSEFAAFAGLGLSVITNTIQLPWMTAGKPTEVPDLIKQVSIPIKLLALMPSFIRPRRDVRPWEDEMDAVITDLAFLKICLDATSVGGRDEYGQVSPYIDYAISALWIVPAVGRIASNHRRTSAYMSLTTSLAFDVSIMTAPIIWNPSMDPEGKLAVFAAANGLIIVAAAVRATTGGILYNDD